MREMMSEMRPGDHAALFYRNQAEQLAAAIPYIQIGLERNERCLYIAGDSSVEDVVSAMDAAGINVAREQKLGRLTVATPDQTYLRHGVFEPEKMVAELADEIQATLQMGFETFRGTGELGWAATLPSALLRLYEYEELFDAAMAPHFIALCQYNETLFSPALISQMIRIHPKVAARGLLRANPYYVGARRLIDDMPAIALEDVFRADASRFPAKSIAIPAAA